LKETTRIEHKNLSMEKTRRSKQRLNKTEIAVLGFAFGKVEASDIDCIPAYAVYASDPKLQKFIGKSRRQISRALRHLEELGLMESSHRKPFRGTPVLFSLTFPQYCTVKRLLGRTGADMLAYYITMYLAKKHNPITTTEMAWRFNVRKRTAQKAMKRLVNGDVVRETHLWIWSRRRRRMVKIPAYEPTEGQKPLTHWTEQEKKGDGKL
jgi:DNA-binding transcriptional ArsR family regulator